MIEVLYEDEDIKISIELFEKYNMYFMHSNVKSWSLSKYKKYLSIFADILNKLNKNGIETIYALPPSEKEEKWEKLFGFTETGYVIGKYKLMEIKTWAQKS